MKVWIYKAIFGSPAHVRVGGRRLVCYWDTEESLNEQVKNPEHFALNLEIDFDEMVSKAKEHGYDGVVRCPFFEVSPEVEDLIALRVGR